MKRVLLLLLLAGCAPAVVVDGSGTNPGDQPNNNNDNNNDNSGNNNNDNNNGNNNGNSGDNGGGSDTYAPIASAREAVPKADALAFARAIAPMIAGRGLTSAESSQLESGGAVALRTLLEAWVQEPGFVETARDLFSVRLKASGTSGTLDGSLPGNLVAYLVKNKRPHAEIVTAETCRSAAGEAIACGSGAPFEAGVLTTRVFLANNAYRFNLKRARTVLQAFACSDYPLSETLQPRIDKSALLEMFQNDLPPENNIFGNGNACYTCHSQFGPHAQAFVKFDADGKWQSGATGLQLDGGEMGVSANKLFASHLATPAAAASEATQYFGKQVANLAELAQALTENPIFLQCAVRTLMGYALALSDSEANVIPRDVVSEIVSEAKRQEPQPTLARLAVETFSHPSMVTARRSP